MGFIQRLKFAIDAFRVAGEVKQPGDNGTLAHMFSARGQPPKRGTQELLNAYNTMPRLRMVVNKVSYGVASVQWQLYAVTGSEGKAIKVPRLQRAGPLERRKLFEQYRKSGELREIENHPFLDMIDQANPLMTGLMARQVTQTWIDLKGESFWVLVRNGAGMPIECWPIPPHWVLDTPTSTDGRFRIKLPGWQGEIPWSEVVWIRSLNPVNPYGRGTGIAESLGDELDTDEYAAKHTKAWFYNRAVPEIMVSVDGAQQPDVERAKQKWESEHRGFWNAYRTYWSNRKIDVVQLSQTFRDQELIELRRFERDAIVEVYGVPPEVLGIVENSNRATIDAADYLFSRWVIQPRLEVLRTEMQEKLIPQFDERLILEYENPVPEDDEFKLKAASEAPWSITVDEWREMQGLPPKEDGSGNVHMVPYNLIPMRELSSGTSQVQSEESFNAGQKENTKTERKALYEDDIDNILEELRPEYLTGELDPIFRQLVEEWGNEVLRDLGLDVSFSMLNPLVVEHLQNKSSEKIKGINETTKKALRQTLVEGVRAGESIPQLAERVSEVFATAKGPRATTIARTEVLHSSNFATYAAHKQSGVVDKRQWVATPDDRVRDEHWAMNGQIRAINKPFTAPGGETAMYPGDFADPALSINCRCTTVAVIDEPKSEDELLAVWKIFDRDLVPWEGKVERAVKKGFQAQQNAIMDALKRLSREGE